MRLFFIFCLSILIAFAGMALAAPIPARKSDALGSYDAQIEQEQSEQKKKKKKANTLQKDLQAAQKKLTKIASSAQRNEKSLSKLDQEIAELEKRQTQLRADMEGDQAALADLFLALQRVRRLPPEALILKPDAPLKTAQSAMLLKGQLPELYAKAEALQKKLTELEALKTDLESKKTALNTTTRSLKEEQSKIAALLEERKTLYRSTQNDIRAREEKMQKIAAQAQNLKDLVQKLETEDNRKEVRKQVHKAVHTKPKSAPTPKDGSARLPISGNITTRYNALDRFGAPSQGIDIEGRGGALVVAPMGGVVRFSGPFKGYGNMVIIEHSKGYHSLVAGLDKIDTIVGQSVLAGEPLGTLHYETGGEKPVLYYELRYNGKAVDPGKKFAGL